MFLTFLLLLSLKFGCFWWGFILMGLLVCICDRISIFRPSSVIMLLPFLLLLSFPHLIPLATAAVLPPIVGGADVDPHSFKFIVSLQVGG